MNARILGTVMAAVMTAGRAQAQLVAHEWGTFTSVAGDDGLSLEWRPLAVDDDLPAFVHGLHDLDGAGQRGTLPRKSRIEGTVRMETPVLYFYAPEPTEVSVHVSFPGGTLTEWYPAVRVAAGPLLDWGKVLVQPGATPQLPGDGLGNHYYLAREVDAAPIRVCGERTEHERFLFYRGVGRVTVPLRVELRGGDVQVTRTADGSVPEVILFERRQGVMRMAVERALVRQASLRRDGPPVSEEDVAGELLLMLLRHGLYPKEARACVETWRASWLEEGLRVFYVMPTDLVERVLPLTIAPAPSELVRVLVGRVEVITPEVEAEVREALRAAASPRPDVRHRGTAALATHGRFTDPILRRLLPRHPELRAVIDAILDGRLPRASHAPATAPAP